MLEDDIMSCTHDYENDGDDDEYGSALSDIGFAPTTTAVDAQLGSYATLTGLPTRPTVAFQHESYSIVRRDTSRMGNSRLVSLDPTPLGLVADHVSRATRRRR